MHTILSIKLRLFARGFSSRFGRYPNWINWVWPWFVYDTVCVYSALASFGDNTLVGRYEPDPLFLSIESSLVRQLDQVLHESSMCCGVFQPFLVEPSPCGTCAVVLEVALCALGWKPNVVPFCVGHKGTLPAPLCQHFSPTTNTLAHCSFAQWALVLWEHPCTGTFSFLYFLPFTYLLLDLSPCLLVSPILLHPIFTPPSLSNIGQVP